ncbi:MAG: chorismate mutase [Oscillospiraceae bacterium]|nr:chorismate mutase [Oscillospiraceae bacterium]
MDIKQLRERIDKTDEQLVSLFCERMKISGEIAEWKAQEGMAVTDKKRERELLTRVSELAGEEMELDVRTLYNLIMSLSRSYQHRKMDGTSKLYEKITKALETTNKLFPERAVIACQGTEGAYSQQACEKLFSAPDILFFRSFDAVFSAVDKGLCKYGILPLENSTAGSVNRIYDLMIQYRFSIVRSTRLHINHALMAKKPVELDKIREIVSHDQALSQCSVFLEGLKNVKLTSFENTAAAAEYVANSNRDDLAVLCSDSCAELYQLTVIHRNCQNVDNNYTRFICISKDLEIYPGAERTSLMMVIPHKPGSLYKVMSRFYALGINLIKLESRPIPGRDFEFMFYFDIDSSVYSPKLAQLLCQMEAETEEFEYLGSYTEVV